MEVRPRGQGTIARAEAGLAAIVLGAVAIAAIGLALGIGDRERLDVLGEGIAIRASESAERDRDPYAWHPSREKDLADRAAVGFSHVIYEMSPGGVVRSARRTAAFRDSIEAAAKRHGADPDVLEAMIFLESAGRPQVIAGPTPESASGLAQILPSTATDLLGMRVDLEHSTRLTKKLAKADSPTEANRIYARRAAIDERFDPDKAIEGAARYLEIARERFGRDDLAVASYHMGIGNLESVIRAYLDAPDKTPIGQLVAGEDLSYTRLYFDVTPSSHPKTYALLSEFGDDSASYLWRVRASQEIMDAYRNDIDLLTDVADLATAKATLEELFHPENETEVFDDAGAIEDARESGTLVEMPHDRALGWVPGKGVGELAARLGEDPGLYRALRPEALATLGYLAGIVIRESGARKPLEVTSAVRSADYQELLRASNPEATDEYSLHTTGWAFDIRRKYESDRQAEAFQFALDRLSALALIDYAVEPGAIHITASGSGDALLAD